MQKLYTVLLATSYSEYSKNVIGMIVDIENTRVVKNGINVVIVTRFINKSSSFNIFMKNHIHNVVTVSINP